MPNDARLPAGITAHPPLRIVAIAGSLRRGSWNLRLLDAASAIAPAGITVEVYRGLGTIPMFDEDLETDGGPAGVHQLRAQVAAADGLLLATPEYNQSLPAVLKNAIDWLSRAGADGSALAGKPVAVMGATTGGWGTRLAQHALRQTLCATGARVMPAPMLYVRDVATSFSDGGALVDPALHDALGGMLAGFARWIVPRAPG